VHGTLIYPPPTRAMGGGEEKREQCKEREEKKACNIDMSGSQSRRVDVEGEPRVYLCTGAVKCPLKGTDI
jgi:hypothetical protein